MKNLVIGRITACEPWQSIQGKKFWRAEEYLKTSWGAKNKTLTILSPALVMECFQLFAAWLILYSSRFNQTGNLNRIDRFKLLKWREIPEILNFQVRVTAKKGQAVVFSGLAFAEEELVAMTEGMVFFLEPVSTPVQAEKFASLWDDLFVTLKFSDGFSKVVG